ncbi:MAG TPA: GGDEF domain-containing protein, partial [Nevskiaceae bacterium]|nr:GGDEF domain-containing protein [Nevskiaceae bacterium]
DIDQFKLINDTHGHLFGDEVIRKVGQAISAHYALRPNDLKARFGGEEFVLLWYQVSGAHFGQLVERLLSAIRQLELPGSDTELVRITASAGALWLVPDSSRPAEAILNQADQLLYQAKAGGRDRMELVILGDPAATDVEPGDQPYTARPAAGL